jgi:hypothetical protein
LILKFAVKKTKSSWQLLILACFIGISFWFFHIAADTDAFLTWDGGLYADEAWNADNALNRYISGNWQTDGLHNFILLMPVMPLIQYVFFEIGQPSLITLRLPAILFSIIVLGLLLNFIRIRLDKKRSHSSLYLALFLFVSNYELFSWARAGRIEMPMLAICLLLYLLVYKFLADKSKVIKKWWGFGSLITVIFCFALLTRPTTLVIIGAMFLGLMLMFANKQITLSKITVIVVATLIGFGLYQIILKTLPFLLNFTPNSTAADVISGNLVFKPENLLNYLTLFSNSLIQANLALIFLALTHVALIGIQIFQRKKTNMLDVLFSTFFITYLIFVGYYSYMPPRWVVPVLIPMVYLVATLPDRLKKATYRNIPIGKLILVLIVLVNLQNTGRCIYYFTNLQYTKRDVAHAITRDIQKDLGRKNLKNITLYGSHSSTFSVTNHLPFSYKIPDEPGKYVVLHGNMGLAPHRAKLIGQYDMLYNYGDMKIHLYKTY